MDPSVQHSGGLADMQSTSSSAVGETVHVFRLTSTSSSLGATGAVGQVKSLVGRSNYVKIRKAVSRYHRAKDPLGKTRELQLVQTLIRQWMAANGSGKNSGNLRRKAKLESLEVEVDAELTAIEQPASTVPSSSTSAASHATTTPSPSVLVASGGGTAADSTVSPDAASTAAQSAEQQEHEPALSIQRPPLRNRVPMAPDVAMVKARTIATLQGELQALSSAAIATPKVRSKVELLKKASASIERLLPLLDDPEMTRVQRATAAYQQAVLTALPALEEQAQYMGDLEGGQDKFAYLSLAGVAAIADAVTLAQGQTRSNGFVSAPGMGAEALRIMKESGITDAEMAAIKIYTAPDYRYMNAGMAQNRGGWLQNAIRQGQGARSADDRILGDADLQPGFHGPRSPADMAAAEGRRHGKYAIQGLRKMPAWKGQVFRGAGFTPDEFQQQYGTNQWSAGSFTSTSTNQQVSQGFAERESSAGGKVGVLMIFDVVDGRDLKDVSTFANEGEILLLPGAKATITKIDTQQGPTGGEVKIVYLTQTA